MTAALPLILWQPRGHNGARPQVSGEGRVHIRTVAGTWSYAASLPLDGAVVATAARDNLRILLEVDLRVEAGRIGVGCLNAAMDSFVTAEPDRGVGEGDGPLRIEVDPRANPGHLMFRNTDPAGTPSEGEVLAIRAIPRPAGWEVEEAPYLAAAHCPLPLAELERVVARFGGLAGTAGSGSIDSVPVATLAARLGQTVPCPTMTVPDLHQWRMEDHDLPLLRWLYRTHQPRRHLEFGTWQGAGVVACAQECAAEIWTLNLPEGERDSSGRPLYGSGVSPSDARGEIGRLYREAGLASRVRQLLCDSRSAWDADLPDGFFDSVLIDGGHTADVVASDTDKALRLLRPGGLCLWHDFCPTPRALLGCVAPRGVVRAVVDHWGRWKPLLKDAFWLRPSWILVGVRA